MRSSFSKMIKQKFANGKWVGLTLGIQYKCLELYHFVPFAFILAILFTTIISFFGLYLFAILLWGAYMLANIAMTITSIIQSKQFHFSNLALPILFLLLHISYGVGTLVGLIKLPFWKHKKENQTCDAIEEVRRVILNSFTEEEM